MNSDEYCPYTVGEEGFAGYGNQTVKVVVQLAEGIHFVGTDKVGGLWFAKDLVDKVPDPWRRGLQSAFLANGSGEIEYKLPRADRKLIQ